MDLIDLSGAGDVADGGVGEDEVEWDCGGGCLPNRSAVAVRPEPTTKAHFPKGGHDTRPLREITAPRPRE